MTAKKLKISTFLLVLLMALTSIYAFAGARVQADETYQDDPNDGIVTASER